MGYMKWNFLNYLQRACKEIYYYIKRMINEIRIAIIAIKILIEILRTVLIYRKIEFSKKKKKIKLIWLFGTSL